MERLEVSTVVYVEPAAVYAFLTDFEGYAAYSEYLDSVTRTGDGTAGTVYEIAVSWWRLDYTLRSEVTDYDPPRRIDWRLHGPIAAAGAWHVEPLSEDDRPAADGRSDGATGSASRVTLEVTYDPDTVDGSGLELPAFVPLDAVVARLEPLVRREAERVTERIVADLEGEPRAVELDVNTHAGPVTG